MMSYPIHDLRALLANGSALDGEMEQHGTEYVGEWRLPPAAPGGLRTAHRSARFSNASDCFEWMLQEATRFAAHTKVPLDALDNPCNDPFIDQQAQKQIAARLGVGATILLNGK